MAAYPPRCPGPLEWTGGPSPNPMNDGAVLVLMAAAVVLMIFII